MLITWPTANHTPWKRPPDRALKLAIKLIVFNNYVRHWALLFPSKKKTTYTLFPNSGKHAWLGTWLVMIHSPERLNCKFPQQLLVQSITFLLTGQFCNWSCDCIYMFVTEWHLLLISMYIIWLSSHSCFSLPACTCRHCINRLHILPNCRTQPCTVLSGHYMHCIIAAMPCSQLGCLGSAHNALHSSSLEYMVWPGAHKRKESVRCVWGICHLLRPYDHIWKCCEYFIR